MKIKVELKREEQRKPHEFCGVCTSCVAKMMAKKSEKEIEKQKRNEIQNIKCDKMHSMYEQIMVKYT